MLEEKVPIHTKYTLSIQEASEYFGIGEKKIRDIVRERPNSDFVLEIGTHVRIKRKMFEKFLDLSSSI